MGLADDLTAAVARKVNPPVPHAKPGPYKTKLTPIERTEFRVWRKANKVPYNGGPKSDYDMHGFFKAMKAGDKRATSAINKSDGQLHYPDTWKTPYHKTFSNESIYARKNAPHWERNKLIDRHGNVVADESKKR